MHKMPGKGERLTVSGERKAPSEAMMRQRERFGAITKMVSQLRRNGSKKSQKQLWKIAEAAYDAASN